MPTQKTILLASANVLDNRDYLIHLKDERRKILDILHPLRLRQEVHIEREIEISFSELFDQFNKPGYFQQPINLFHYSGHSNEEKLILEDAVGGNKSISARQLADFLKLQPGLEVVFLNSCSSESIGALLLDSGVGAVIETTTVIRDADASRFAEWVYKGLHAGKSLVEAFEQAVVSYESEVCCCTRKESNLRDISGFFSDEEEERCAWKLAFNDKAFVENWYLVERIRQRFYDANVTTRVLAVYAPVENNEPYYSVLRGAFLGQPEILVYSISEILTGDESEMEKLIADSHVALFILSEGFSNFWMGLDRWKPALKNLQLIFLGCDGDVQRSFQLVNEELLREKSSVFPPYPFTLKQLSEKQNLETAFNSFCADLIRKEISNPFNKLSEVLTEEFDNLNFGKQRRPFESTGENSFQFSTYNLILVEGSLHCAQELLVKKLLMYAKPRIAKNINPNVISIGKNVPNVLTQAELYQQLADTLIGRKISLGMDHLIETITQKIEQEDLVIVMNDVFQENGDCLPIFREFWNELIEKLPPESKHRLFLFIIHKACKESKNHWNTIGFTSNPPFSNVRLLDAIEPLHEVDLNSWHANTGKRFPDGHFFYSLIEEKQAKQILQEPYMTKAIAEICHLMKCPGILSEILKI